MIQWINWRWKSHCTITNLYCDESWFRWSSEQGGNSYEEMKNKLSDSTSISQITLVSDSHWCANITAVIPTNIFNVIYSSVANLWMSTSRRFTFVFLWNCFCKTSLSWLQDLKNTKLNKTPVGGGGGGYRAPGGPLTSPPPNKAYFQDETDFFPRPSSPTRPQSGMSSSSASSLSSSGAGKFFDPELLINKTPDELPEGVDPTQKEVCVQINYKW